jgi:hypothetical protein
MGAGKSSFIKLASGDELYVERGLDPGEYWRLPLRYWIQAVSLDSCF